MTPEELARRFPRRIEPFSGWPDRFGVHEIKLVEKARREGWDIPPPTARFLVERMGECLHDPEFSRDIQAARVLVSIEKMNRESEAENKPSEVTVRVVRNPAPIAGPAPEPGEADD